MADFAVNVPNQGSSEGFIGASKGATAPEAAKSVSDQGAGAGLLSKAATTRANTSLIGEVGTLFEAGVNFADKSIKTSITDKVHENLDQIYDEFGVGDVALNGRSLNEPPPTPSEINTSIKNLNMLKASADKGVANPNNVQARVESVARQLRAKYPGHRDYVDQEISKVNGGSPANEIIRNLTAEAKALAAKGNSEETHRLGLIKEYNDKGILQPGWEKQSFNDLINNHAPLLRQIQARQTEKADIEIAKGNGELVDRKIEISARNVVEDKLSEATNLLINPTGKSYNDLNTLLTRSVENPASLSEEEQANLRARMAEYKNKIIQSTNAALTEQFGGNISAKTREDALAPINNHIKGLEDALTNKDVGTLYAITHRLEDKKTRDDLTLLTHPVLGMSAAYQRNLGPEAASLFLQNNARLKTARDKSIFADSVTKSFSMQNTSLVERIKAATESGADDPKAVGDALLKHHIDVLLSPTSKAEGVIQAAKNLYGSDNASFLSQLKADKRELVYNRLTSPEVFSKMKQLKDAGDKTTYDNYVGWTKNAMPSLFKSSADELSKLVTNTTIPIHFDDKSGQFSVAPDAKTTGKNLFGNNYGSEVDVIGRSSLQPAIDKMNSSLRGILPIMKEEGVNPTSFISNAFKNLGIRSDGTVLGQMKASVALPGKMNVGGPFPGDRTVGDLPGTVITNTSQNSTVQSFNPGDTRTLNLPGVGISVLPQVTAAAGDTKQLDELSSFATKSRQDIKLFQQMLQESPENADARQALDNAVANYQEATSQINALHLDYVKQFEKKKK